jgi:hypothetical protein
MGVHRRRGRDGNGLAEIGIVYARVIALLEVTKSPLDVEVAIY